LEFDVARPPSPKASASGERLSLGYSGFHIDVGDGLQPVARPAWRPAATSMWKTLS